MTLASVSIILFSTSAFLAPVAIANDLEIYSEHVTWSSPAANSKPGIGVPTFEDSTMARLRLYASPIFTGLSPYASLSIQRDRTSNTAPDSANTRWTKGGFGLRLASEKIPIQIYAEGRYSHEWHAESERIKIWHEGLLLATTGGSLRHLAQLAWLSPSWYFDATQVWRGGGSRYGSGSGWARASLNLLETSSWVIDVDPIDTTAYRECVTGCSSWIFGGIGALVKFNIASGSSVQVRASTGQRWRYNVDNSRNSFRANRLLLTFGGDF